MTDVYAGEYMFEKCTALTVHASKSRFALLEPVTITFSAVPVYDGLGVLYVQFLPEMQSDAYQPILVDSPYTEAQDGGYSYHARGSFNRGSRFKSSWVVRVQTRTKHVISAFASFDSVCIDSSHCYPMGSDEARERFGWLDRKPAANYPYELAAPQD